MNETECMPFQTEFDSEIKSMSMQTRFDSEIACLPFFQPGFDSKIECTPLKTEFESKMVKCSITMAFRKFRLHVFDILRITEP